MIVIEHLDDPILVDCLRSGGVAVVRTDTLYGIIARADDSTAVQRIFKMKQRSPDKPLLVLIDSLSQLFDKCAVDRLMGEYWPGKNTVILPSPSAPEFITRGTQTVAYRMPDDESLRRLIRHAGPLVAPSANPEGVDPAVTVNQAVAYFGDMVDVYVDGGEVVDQAPSRIFRYKPEGDMERVR